MCSIDTDFSNTSFDATNQDERLSRNSRRIGMISHILYVVNLLFMGSYNFSTLFVRHSGLDAHLRFLTDPQIFAKIVDVKIIDISGDSMRLIGFLLLNISSMSRNFEENARKWIDSNAFNVMIDLSKRFADLADLVEDAYTTIANIATDKQIESLDDIERCIYPVIKRVNLAGDEFKDGK